MIIAGGSVYEGKTLLGRRPRVTFSNDGRDWTAPRRVLEEGDWLWRITWHGGKAYGVSYDPNDGTAARAAAPAAEWALKLFASSDGMKYDLVTQLDVPGQPNETTLRFLPDGDHDCPGPSGGGRQGRLDRPQPPPYKAWNWYETKYPTRRPELYQPPRRLPLGRRPRPYRRRREDGGGPDDRRGRLRARADPPQRRRQQLSRTRLARRPSLDELLLLPRGQTSIYLAKVKLPLKAEAVGGRLEPFVDEHMIDRLGGASIRAAEAHASGGRPGRRQALGGEHERHFTVFADGDRYRMYYRGSHFDVPSKSSTHREVTSYAESKDGLTWEKPGPRPVRI